MSVERLAADYLGPADATGSHANSTSSPPFPTDSSKGAPLNAESPALFKVSGVFFLTSCVSYGLLLSEHLIAMYCAWCCPPSHLVYLSGQATTTLS